MSRYISLTTLVVLLLAALACSKVKATQTVSPTSIARPRSTATLATLPTASPIQTSPAKPAPTSTDQAGPTAAGTGSISGQVCYPGSAIPRMSIYAVDQTAHVWYKVQTFRPDETAYRIEGVVPGTYVVYAWLEDGKLGGSYSKAVPCGLSADCKDHALIAVTIKPGQNVTGVDMCDWYGPPPPAPPK